MKPTPNSWTWGFTKLGFRGTLLGVPYWGPHNKDIRTIVYCCLYWGLPFLGNYHFVAFGKFPKMQGAGVQSSCAGDSRVMTWGCRKGTPVCGDAELAR